MSNPEEKKCPEVEPSVEETVLRIIQEQRHGFMTVVQARIFAEIVVDKLRNERNRHG